MFVEGQLVEVYGAFHVANINDEYIELDPVGKGNVDSVAHYKEQGFTEINSDGTEKDFDGVQLGDYFKLQGAFKVERSNEVFTKIKVNDLMFSIPNHKLEVVGHD